MSIAMDPGRGPLVFVLPELSSVRDYVITHSVGSMSGSAELVIQRRL